MITNKACAQPAKPLVDKLGVNPRARVAVLGVEDESFWEQLRERTGDIREGELETELDVIFLLAERVEPGKARFVAGLPQA